MGHVLVVRVRTFFTACASVIAHGVRKTFCASRPVHDSSVHVYNLDYVRNKMGCTQLSLPVASFDNHLDFDYQY